MQFNKWTVIGDAAPDKHGLKRWLCRCECGREAVVTQTSVRRGKSKGCMSCGRHRYQRNDPTMPGGTNARSAYTGYAKSARRHSRVFELTFEDFLRLSQLPCYYCGLVRQQVYDLRNPDGTPRVAGGPWPYNGIDRLDSSQGYVVTNCVPCCSRCNFAKHRFSESDFLQTVKRIYEYRNLDKQPLCDWNSPAALVHVDGTSKSRKQSAVRSRRRQRPRAGHAPAGV